LLPRHLQGLLQLCWQLFLLLVLLMLLDWQVLLLLHLQPLMGLLLCRLLLLLHSLLLC
jgi:hypothetical protein